MSPEPDLYYLYQPREQRESPLPVEFLPVTEFLQDEPACKRLWDLITNQFHTRSKFLAIWSGVRYLAVHRAPHGQADGFLLVTTPVNWQIDYVVVHPESRGQGIAAALVTEVLHQAYLQRAPYVMLTSKPALRGLYENCGFAVVGSSDPVPV
jgi:ribosomal protein S18 acetylase RimI-like enzyme